MCVRAEWANNSASGSYHRDQGGNFHVLVCLGEPQKGQQWALIVSRTRSRIPYHAEDRGRGQIEVMSIGITHGVGL